MRETELNKGPFSFSIAWWEKGAHELSLGRPADAVESFRESRRYSEAALTEKEDKQVPNSDLGQCACKRLSWIESRPPRANRRGTTYSASPAEEFAAMMPGWRRSGRRRKSFGLDQLQTMQARINARESIS